jgi:hypothetical protein
MVIEILDRHERGGWTVDLARSNYRPNRPFVELTRDEAGQEYRSWCVGYSDDEGESRRLFDAVVRVVKVLTTGKGESLDWAEVPPGEILI